MNKKILKKFLESHCASQKIIALGIGENGSQILNFSKEISGIKFAKLNNKADCEKFEDADLIFVIGDSEITADVAKFVKDLGILTIAIASTDNDALKIKLKDNSDTLISFDESIFLDEQMNLYKNVLESVSDLVINSGFVNLDFEDIKNILHDNGIVFWGSGRSEEGADRAKTAALRAIQSCERVKNAKNVLLCVKTGNDVSLTEVAEAAAIVKEVADPDVQFVWGHVIDDKFGDSFQVTFIAGMNDNNRSIQKLF